MVIEPVKGVLKTIQSKDKSDSGYLSHKQKQPIGSTFRSGKGYLGTVLKTNGTGAQQEKTLRLFQKKKQPVTGSKGYTCKTDDSAYEGDNDKSFPFFKIVRKHGHNERTKNSTQNHKTARNSGLCSRKASWPENILYPRCYTVEHSQSNKKDKHQQVETFVVQCIFQPVQTRDRSSWSGRHGAVRGCSFTSIRKINAAIIEITP